MNSNLKFIWMLLLFQMVGFVSGCASASENIEYWEILFCDVGEYNGVVNNEIVAIGDTVNLEIEWSQKSGHTDYDLQPDPNWCVAPDSCAFCVDKVIVNDHGNIEDSLLVEADLELHLHPGVWQIAVKAVVDQDSYSKYSEPILVRLKRNLVPYFPVKLKVTLIMK